MITLERPLANIRPNELELLTDREKKLWLPPEKLTVSEWADRNRVLTPMTSAEPGQWRTERTPYLKGIMDTFTDPFIEEISIMASTQVGKTECLYNMLGYVIDQDAGPTLLVMPRKEDAESVSVNRIQPMLYSSPALAKYLPKHSDSITKLEYHLDTMIVYFCGSNSPAALAQRPIRYLFLDEIDKYPKFSGKEADPIKLAKERTRTFWNRKIVKVSTPTIKEGYIYREYEKSDQCRYYVPCPHCGEYQYLLFPQVKFPKDERNPEKIEKLKLAWYECVHCQKRIDDNQKNRMLIQGVWAPEGSEIDANGNILKGLRDTKHRMFWMVWLIKISRINLSKMMSSDILKMILV